MNILYLQSDTGLTGGIANYVSTLVKSLNKRNKKYKVFVSGDFRKQQLNQFQALYPKSKLFRVLSTYNIITFFWMLFIIRYKLVKHKISVVHAHALRAGFIGGFSCIFSKSKLIYTNHGLRFLQKEGKFSKKLFLIFELLVLISCSQYVCIRKIDMKIMKKVSPKIFANKIGLITTRIYELKGNTKKFNKKKPIHLCFIGDLIERKSPKIFVEWLIEINNQDINYEASIFGEGEEKNNIKILAKKNKVNVNFKGHVISDNIKKFLNNTDNIFLCVPSKLETLPLVILESYSSGIPVISLDRFGVRDYLKSKKTGYIISASKNSFYPLIKTILNDVKLYNQLSTNCVSTFNNQYRGSDFMLKEYIRIYNS